jgi:hypothetical protein
MTVTPNKGILSYLGFGNISSSMHSSGLRPDILYIQLDFSVVIFRTIVVVRHYIGIF